MVRAAFYDEALMAAYEVDAQVDGDAVTLTFEGGVLDLFAADAVPAPRMMLLNAPAAPPSEASTITVFLEVPADFSYSIQRVYYEKENLTTDITDTFADGRYSVTIPADVASLKFECRKTDGEQTIIRVITIEEGFYDGAVWTVDSDGEIVSGESGGTSGTGKEPEIAPVTTTYTVTLPQDISGGRVEISGGNNAFTAGQTVTLEVTPEACYALSTLTVKQGENDVATTAGENGTYTFTMPEGNVTVSAGFVLSSITYLDANGVGQTCENYTLLTSNTVTWTGWFVASGEVNISSRVNVSGEAHLILADGATVTIPKGIHVGVGNSLTIYGQSTGDGALTINNVPNDCAGIGGQGSEVCGSVTINGGAMDVTGGSYGAGIGGGWNRAGGTITINSGVVDANGGSGGAGIGDGSGSRNSGMVIIHGGVVTAKDGHIGGTNSTISLDLPDGASVKTDDEGFMGTVIVEANRSVSDGAAHYAGTLNEAQMKAIKTKTLVNGPVSYAVTLATGIEHGTLTASHTYACKGDTVTLTVVPSSSCGLVALTVDGQDVTDSVLEKQYAFTMPDHAVEVSATFVEWKTDENGVYTVPEGGASFNGITLTRNTTIQLNGNTLTVSGGESDSSYAINHNFRVF